MVFVITITKPYKICLFLYVHCDAYNVLMVVIVLMMVLLLIKNLIYLFAFLTIPSQQKFAHHHYQLIHPIHQPHHHYQLIHPIPHQPSHYSSTHTEFPLPH